MKTIKMHIYTFLSEFDFTYQKWVGLNKSPFLDRGRYVTRGIKFNVGDRIYTELTLDALVNRLNAEHYQEPEGHKMATVGDFETEVTFVKVERFSSRNKGRYIRKTARFIRRPLGSIYVGDVFTKHFFWLNSPDPENYLMVIGTETEKKYSDVEFINKILPKNPTFGFLKKHFVCPESEILDVLGINARVKIIGDSVYFNGLEAHNNERVVTFFNKF